MRVKGSELRSECSRGRPQALCDVDLCGAGTVLVNLLCPRTGGHQKGAQPPRGTSHLVWTMGQKTDLYK